MDHNRFHGVGRLVKDPVYFAPGAKGDEHCTFILAINRVVSNEDGPQADFILCSLWGEEARKLMKGRAKGDEVGILGRIHTSLVGQADGSRKFFWEVRVEEVEYGRRSLSNLQPRPRQDKITKAVGALNMEFGDSDGISS